MKRHLRNGEEEKESGQKTSASGGSLGGNF